MTTEPDNHDKPADPYLADAAKLVAIIAIVVVVLIVVGVALVRLI